MADAVHVIEGSLDASGLRFAVVVARFNAFITDRLSDGAVDALVRSGASASDVTVIRVAGAWELPQVVRRAATSGDFDAVIGLGCLVRGDTIHFDLIAAEAAKGLSEASRAAEIPVAFGVLTTDTLEQAINRAGGKAGNKGAEAAMAAVEQVRVLAAMSPKPKASKSAGTKKSARKKRK